MVEQEKLLKKKYQIKFDEELPQRLSTQLQVELDEEAMLEREKEEEASNAVLIEEWDSIEARIDVDAQLAERLQVEEREHMSVEDQARLLMEFIAARKKFFSAKRAEEQRNKPPTKSEQRKKMCTYMKHMAGYKDKNFKGKRFAAIKHISKKKAESSKKRTRAVLDEENVKRQKVEDDAEKAELKACLEIVPGDDSAVNIEYLATKYPIVDWKTHILAEDIVYYQITRVDGSTKHYKLFSAMLDDFDRQDVLDLYKLVKERFKTTSPEGYDRLLWGDLITLFEPSEEDEIWKTQQDYTLISWKLYDSCGVHLLLMDTGSSIHMLGIPSALLPGYIAESDLEEDLKEDYVEDPIDYTPIPFPSEEEVAMLFSLPTPPPSPLTPLSSPLPQIPSPPTHYPLLLPASSTSCRADIPEAELPPQKRLLLTTPTPRFEIGESSTAAAARQPRSTVAHRVDYGFMDTLDASICASEHKVMAAVESVNLRVNYQASVHRRESEEFQTRH
ncbi:hypothetical protein Tco_1326831 [Tanacetum coccineum]